MAVQVHASTMPDQKTLLVFGDSLSAAYGIDSRKGWVALLQEKLADSYPEWQIVNASIGGETTSGGLSRLPEALETHTPDLVLIQLGANDGLRGLPLKGMKNNLSRMIALSQQQNADVLLFEMRIPPNYGPVYSRRFQGVFSELVDQHNIELVPFFLDGVAGYVEKNQADGIHPKASAQPELLENVWKVLASEL
ncbi:MAG: arylesterase [Oceanospirillales bacterium LUC14_002_19_P2]|nr:MAG: arylesterase [Oceanospirillales bacterium LUC14_002_19_P2]